MLPHNTNSEIAGSILGTDGIFPLTLVFGSYVFDGLARDVNRVVGYLQEKRLLSCVPLADQGLGFVRFPVRQVLARLAAREPVDSIAEGFMLRIRIVVRIEIARWLTVEATAPVDVVSLRSDGGAPCWKAIWPLPSTSGQSDADNRVHP